MLKRSLMLLPFVLYCSCAVDPTQDTDSPDASSAEAEREAAAGIEASAWVSEDGGDEAVEAAASTPGLEQRLYAVPASATVIPAEVTEQLTAAARARGGAHEKRLLVSVHVPLAAPRWERIESAQGPSWRLAIVSEDAAFLRPHFVNFPRSEEAQVVVYGASADQRAAVVTPTLTATTPDVWGPIVDGSVLFVEVVTASGAQPSLVVDVVGSGIPRTRKAEEDCYLDPACYGAWKSAKSAIGRMYFEEGINGYVCSGSMITDKSKSGKPYFLTANHCISTNGVADTLEVSWKFQTSSCNGPVPNINSTPYTLGASLKKTNKSSDVTLLQLDSKPPSGTVYLGWTTKALDMGTDITVIHHPAGTFKRISFGDVTESAGNFWRVVYKQSSTEGGSSGSPLLLNSTKQIVGQLYNGNALCTNMSGYDQYGKFSVSWSKGLSTYLNK